MKKNQRNLYFDPSSKLPWYKEFDAMISKVPICGSCEILSTETSTQYRSRGRVLYDQQRSVYQDIEAYSLHGISKQDVNWYETIKTSGTKKDQLMAKTLMISSCPVYHLDELQSLLELLSPSNSSSRKEYILDVSSTIIHLFLTSTSNPNSILPPDRKLKCMEHRQPISNVDEGTKDLLIFCWFVEDVFCRAYADVVSILKNMLRDELVYVKHRALDMIAQCLISNPEQEQNLLSMIIDKFSDSNKKTCSKTIQVLYQVVESHCNMIPVIIDNVCDFVLSGLMKSNKSLHFCYYSIVFLTRIPGNINQHREAYSTLMKCYLKMLHHLTFDMKQQRINSMRNEKVIAYLFKGIRNILPKIDLKSQELDEEFSNIYRLIDNGSNWDMSLQALCLLFNVVKFTKDNSLFKFLDVLYSKMLDEGIPSSSLLKQFHFLQLIRRVMYTLVDENLKNVKGNDSSSPWCIMRRLLQIGIIFNDVPFVCYSLGIMIECLQLSKHFQRVTKSMFEGKCKENLFILSLLVNHYHPSVSKLANNVIKAMNTDKMSQDERIAGLDLESFVQFESLSASKFLERFSLKTPKIKMAPVECAKRTTGRGNITAPRTNGSKIPEHELFILEHYNVKQKIEEQTKRRYAKRPRNRYFKTKDSCSDMSS